MSSNAKRKPQPNPSSIDGIVPRTRAPALPERTLLPPAVAPAAARREWLARPGKPPVAARQKAKHRRSKWKVAGLIIGIVALVAIGLGAWDAWQLYHKVNHLAVGNLTPSVNGDENILVAGSTNRCNLKVQNAQWGFCTASDSGVNSDVIFVVHLNAKTKKVSVLSIPRDTFVLNARTGNFAFKIDAALYEGPSQLVKVVEQDFGIPIQHYVEVGFDGFVNIVNAIGGIKMYFPMPVYDSYSHLDVTTPGCKTLNGVEALQVVRARHLQYKPAGVTTDDPTYWPQEVESDIARITRTHEFLKVVAQTVVSHGLGNPLTDQKLVDAIAPQVQVDDGFSISTMLQLIDVFHDVSINSVPQYTLPVSLTNFGDYYYDGSNEEDVVFPSAPQDQQAVDQFLGITSGTNPLTDKPFPAALSIKVNVVNGSGVPYQATDVTNSLSGLGFDMVGQPGTAVPASTQAQETIVYYGSSATESDALAVAAKLSGYVILDPEASMLTPGSVVTVLTGTNTGVIGTKSSSSTQSAAASTSSNALAAPTSAIQGLAPWDPRMCPKP